MTKKILYNNRNPLSHPQEDAKNVIDFVRKEKAADKLMIVAENYGYKNCFFDCLIKEIELFMQDHPREFVRFSKITLSTLDGYITNVYSRS